jgi:hypothetical protein
MLLAILSGFTYNIMASGLLFFIVGLLPLSFIIAFCGLELGIAFYPSSGICSVNFILYKGRIRFTLMRTKMIIKVFFFYLYICPSSSVLQTKG